jgi:cbb3-type cytochrome oxidase subunit 3
MLKYIKEYAATIDGISIYPVISLLIFFLFFIALLYYVKKMDRRQIEELRHIPLDTEDLHTETKLQNNLNQVQL